MLKLQTLKINASFKYLWLKSVAGVDLSNHCAKCLIGKYDSRVNSTVKEAADILLNEEVYYLCGVSQPFVYEKNFHLAFKRSQGSTLKIERNGVYVVIENAVEIPFTADDIDYSLPQSRKREYYTCRNWQFANKFNKGLKNVL